MFRARVWAIWLAARRWLTSRGGIRTLVGTVIVFAVVLVAESAAGDFLLGLLKDLGEWIVARSKQPSGWFLFWDAVLVSAWIAFWTTFVLVASWRETRPKPEPANVSPEPTPLSSEARESVQHARVLWKTEARRTTEGAMALLGSTRMRLHTPLTPLLEYQIKELRDARTEMAECVDDHSQLPLGQVAVRLVLLIEVYYRCSWMLRDCKSFYEKDLADTQYVEEYRQWLANHDALWEPLRNLTLRVDYSLLRGHVPDRDSWARAVRSP